MKWTAVMFGPDDTPWEGGTFQLEVSFTEEFPTKAPHVKFLTKMFHPNIYNNGEICLDIVMLHCYPCSVGQSPHNRITRDHFETAIFVALLINLWSQVELHVAIFT